MFIHTFNNLPVQNLLAALHCPECIFLCHSTAAIYPSSLKFQPSSYPKTISPGDIYFPISMSLLQVVKSPFWQLHLFHWPLIFQGPVQVALLAKSPHFPPPMNFFLHMFPLHFLCSSMRKLITVSLVLYQVCVCVQHLCSTISSFGTDCVFPSLHTCLSHSHSM